MMVRGAQLNNPFALSGDPHLEFFKSCLRTEGTANPTEAVLEWIQRRNREIQVDIREIPLDHISGWLTEPQTGNLRHETGKFFTVEGIRIRTNAGLVKSWSQPIIHQPEIGYLGFLVKRLDGVYHFLVQAKIEPGNVNNVQLSPTVQATRSNYTGVHQGKRPAYIEYFRERRGRVLLDQLQSEQGARFFRKRNRNIIIEVDDDVPVMEDFKWLTLGQLKELLRQDNIVNMDTRTVISGITYGNYSGEFIDLLQVFSPPLMVGYDQDVYYSYIDNTRSLHSFSYILSWLTELKSAYELEVNLIPLNNVETWQRDDYRIYHTDHKYFEVIGVDVTISSREVAKWSQPIVRPCQEGIVAFISKKVNGVLHFVVQAKLEVGNMDIVELAPTVQCITGNYRRGQNEYEVPFLDYVLNARPDQIKYDVLLSEEGGRFYRSQNRNIVLLADPDFSEQLPPNFVWMTLNQIMRFMQYNNYLNIEARSLLSVLAFSPQAKAGSGI
jgi:oxidase EvaA